MACDLHGYIRLELLHEGTITIDDLEDFSDNLKETINSVLVR